MGGDGVGLSLAHEAALGSPPRGRGRHTGRARRDRVRGLTPAWAGTASSTGLASSPARAHPRVGGDGSPPASMRAARSGSPPRGRGRRPLHPIHAHHAGLTPAWAGTARPRCCGSGSTWAHPRVGGDGGFTAGMIAVGWGSPPRGRGRRQRGARGLLQRGLTPAWAGTAVVALASRSTLLGSPPRGRGRPRDPLGAVGGRGLTPAWAGTAGW